MRIKVLFLIYALLFFGCSGENLDSSTERLFRWSGSNEDYSKKVLFIHGRFNVEEEGSLGHNHSQIETMFASKLVDINAACRETYGFDLTSRAEIWFSTYNTHQEIDDSVADLANDISELGWDGDEICIVGYSQGGVVAWELDCQYPDLLAGAITLGSPIDGTPLASPILVDAVWQDSMSWLPEGWLWEASLWLTQGADNIVDSREEREVNNPFLMIAGEITAPPPERFSLNVVDTIFSGLDDIFDGGVINPSTRQHAELGATIIANASWREDTELNRISDGLVPVSSAIYCATVAEVKANYDHFDLLSGKDDMILPRREFEWIDHILNLSEEVQFIDEEFIPDLPEINIIATNPLDKVKYAYVQNGLVWTAKDKWQTQQISESDVVCSFPRFNHQGDKLVWMATGSEQEFVCYMDRTGSLTWLSSETSKSMANFSPNDEWLVYQSDDQLVIYEFRSGEEFVVLSSGVDIVCPPYWITARLGLNGRIYFANQESGRINLYWISPRKRDVSISTAKLVVSDCEQPFWLNGSLGGIVAIANERDGDDIVSQRVSIVTNSSNPIIKIDIEYNSQSPGFVRDIESFKLALSDYLGFESAAIEFSGGFGAAYLTNDEGIYLLDVGKYISEPDSTFNDVFQLLIEGGSDLDMNPAWE